MKAIPDGTVNLIVTSPPYPMIEMWDEMFSSQHPAIRNDLESGNGMAAYQLSKNVKFGDVNGDGNVDVSDVTALINMILGTTPADLEVADINADGILDVTDVTALINAIL